MPGSRELREVVDDMKRNMLRTFEKSPIKHLCLRRGPGPLSLLQTFFWSTYSDLSPPHFTIHHTHHLESGNPPIALGLPTRWQLEYTTTEMFFDRILRGTTEALSDIEHARRRYIAQHGTRHKRSLNVEVFASTTGSTAGMNAREATAVRKRAEVERKFLEKLNGGLQSDMRAQAATRLGGTAAEDKVVWKPYMDSPICQACLWVK